MSFDLDARLKNDTVHVCDLELSSVRLMKDARYPWLILVPRREAVVEVFDLNTSDQRTLIYETARCAKVIQTLFDVDKVNVASLGNIVRQFHMHVVGRRTSDQAWPGPVWGVGDAEPYEVGALEALSVRCAAQLMA